MDLISPSKTRPEVGILIGNFCGGFGLAGNLGTFFFFFFSARGR